MSSWDQRSVSVPPLLIFSSSHDLSCSWTLHQRSTLASYREVLPTVNGVATVGSAPSIGGQACPDFFVSAQAGRAALHIYSYGRDTPLFKCATQEPLTCLASSSPGCGSYGSGGSFPAYIVGGSATGKLYLWDVATGDLLRIWQGHYKAVSSLAFSKCSGLLVSGSLDCTVHAWDVSALIDAALLSDPNRLPSSLASWTAHSLPITQLSIMHGSGGGTAQFIIISSSLDRTIRIFAVVSSQVGAAGGEGERGGGTGKRDLSSFSSSSSSSLVCVTLPAAISSMITDSMETTIYAGCVNGKIYPLTISEMMMAAESQDEFSNGSGSGGGGGEMLFQDLSSAFLGHRAVVNSLALTPDNQILVSGGDDGAVHIWDCSSRQKISSFEAHKSSVVSVVVMRRPYSLAPSLQSLTTKTSTSSTAQTMSTASSTSTAAGTTSSHQQSVQLQQQHRLSGAPACSISPLRKHAVVIPAVWRGSSTGPLSGAGMLGSGPVRYYSGGKSSEAGFEETLLASDADALLFQSLSTLLTLDQYQKALQASNEQVNNEGEGEEENTDIQEVGEEPQIEIDEENVVQPQGEEEGEEEEEEQQEKVEPARKKRNKNKNNRR